jgi:hypothetical protein
MVSDLTLGSATATDSVARALNNNGNVHPVDSDFWVVLLPGEIRVISDPKGKVSLIIKVPRRNGVVSTVEGIG